MVFYKCLNNLPPDNGFATPVVEGKVNPLEEIHVSVGDKGVAESRMAPVGFAVFNSQRMEAYSIEGVISKGNTIEVVKIENNKVYVTDDVTA